MDALNQLKSSLADRYSIEREIGAGGMATVYLARDIRHDRLVALKLLNPELGAVLGVERFLAEIKVTANLQHPNLLPLFDSGEAEGLLFYVMPYVEGETLRTRIDREKQLPVDEAIRIAVAIANALEYAHSHGVIHRDLKPENILLQSGEPVVADFGIALAVSKAGGNRITQTGLSLGTPNYMSPEQATGDRTIDARSDIYSLGAMTYEMLTGEPPHTGNTSQAVIARMLTEKPRPIRTTRSAVPEYVEDAVQRSLEKLPADRFSSARQFAEALLGRSVAIPTGMRERARASAQPSWKSRLRDPLVIGLSALSLILVVVALIRGRQPAQPTVQPIRFLLATSDSTHPFDNFPWPGAISPDGTTIVYSVITPSGPLLYTQHTNQLESHPIPGTLGASQPLFSPDGQWVAYEGTGKLRKVRLDGSAPIAVADAGADNGADWTSQDEFVTGSEGSKRGLSKVSASGGELVEFAKPDKSKGESDYLWPIALPDGKRIVFAVWSGSLTSSQLATASLDGEVVSLGLKGIRPLAVIGRILVYVQADGAVVAVQLDKSGRHVDGNPSPVLDPVPVTAANNGNTGIFISSGGALLTSRGGNKSQLAWFNRDGTPKLISAETRDFANPRLSPDGTRIAVAVRDREKSDIWVYDLPTGTFSRLSSVPAAASPSWTPDGSRIVFVGLGDKQRFAIWSQRSDGGAPAQKLFDVATLTIGLTVSPDGRSAIYNTYYNNVWALFRTALDSAAAAVPYLVGSSNVVAPRFSPDGHWVALESDESGRSEIYARSFPDAGARLQISAGGGIAAAWSADGTRIFYTSGNVLMSARLATTPTLRVIARDTAVTRVSQAFGGTYAANYDVAKDGRFLGLNANNDDFQLVIVPNWLPELRSRLYGNK
jgi:eukaryotic-like serine/threonine-protein kinase